MATSTNRASCVVCNKKKIAYLCDGCSEHFCVDHLPEHRKNLGKQLDCIENDHDGLRQNFEDQKPDLTPHPLMKKIDQWEQDSIHKIKQAADQCGEKLIKYTNEYFLRTEKEFNHSSEKIKETRCEDDFNEIDLNHLKQILHNIQERLLQPSKVSIRQQSASLINNISIQIPLPKDTRWKQLGMTIAGGSGQGNQLNQLSNPLGICVDDNDQTTYIADSGNDRIVEWAANATNSRIVAGGNGKGNQTNQLNGPSDVIIDRENNSLIIADRGNRRVMRWSRQTSSHGEIIIEDIDCCCLTMHKDGSLYISDLSKHAVRRWKKGEINGTNVVGGNGQSNQLNQLDTPVGIFVDDNYTLYVSDQNNHRVMKWMKDAKEGIVVAGGNGQGDRVTQLSCPGRMIVDHFGQIYVSDRENNRVMRWCEGAKEGTIVVSRDEHGEQAHQLNGPRGLSFDREGNLYVADYGNHRIQKFVKLNKK